MAEERDPTTRAARKATSIGAPTLPKPMEAGVGKPASMLARTAVTTSCDARACRASSAAVPWAAWLHSASA